MGNGASIGGSRATSRTSGTANTIQRHPVFNVIVPLKRPNSTINEEEFQRGRNRFTRQLTTSCKDT